MLQVKYNLYCGGDYTDVLPTVDTDSNVTNIAKKSHGKKHNAVTFNITFC